MWEREPWTASTAPHASGSARLTTPSQPFPGISLPRFLDHLKDIELSIRFTKEEESDEQLAFLDMLLHREDDGTISTSVYRKATHTNQYLSFRSYHPMAHKVAVVRTPEQRTCPPPVWSGQRKGSRSQMH